MNDPVLMQLFRTQAGRLGATIDVLWAAWLAGDDAALTALQYQVHLLKGAALGMQTDALATALHTFESDLRPGGQTLAKRHWPAVQDALRPWREEMADAGPESPADLRHALYSSFAAAAKAADQPAILDLQIDSIWPGAEGFLLDVLPQLFRNALVHGGEPAVLREAAGKPARLQVRVRMRRLGPGLGGRWQLTVADDGRGMPRPAAQRPAEPDQMSGRGWGVAAVGASVAGLPSGRLAFRSRAGAGSVVRITCRY